MRLVLVAALVGGVAFGACEAAADSAVVNVLVLGQPFGVVPSAHGCWLFVSLPAGSISVLHRDGGRVEVARTAKVKRASYGDGAYA